MQIPENKKNRYGIFKNKQYENEKHLEKSLKQWLEGRTMIKKGNNHGPQHTKYTSKITRVERQYDVDDGVTDIAIFHKEMDLSWTHKLANPLLIELKKDNVRKAAAQAIQYKKQSNSKYTVKRGRPTLQTAIASETSLKKGSIALHDTEKANASTKRVYWNLGIGVVQSVWPNKILITFNEGDKILIN